MIRVEYAENDVSGQDELLLLPDDVDVFACYNDRLKKVKDRAAIEESKKRKEITSKIKNQKTNIISKNRVATKKKRSVDANARRKDANKKSASRCKSRRKKQCKSTTILRGIADVLAKQRNRVDKIWSDVSKQQKGPSSFLRRSSVSVAAMGSSLHLIDVCADDCARSGGFEDSKMMLRLNSEFPHCPSFTPSARAYLGAVCALYMRHMTTLAQHIVELRGSKKSARRLDHESIKLACSALDRATLGASLDVFE